MRIYILPILIFCCLSASVSAQDKEIEKMMSKRVLSYSDASYNSVLLIPRLYKEKKEDTLSALISFYERNFGSAPDVVMFIILNDIKHRTFRETIKYYPSVPDDSTGNISDSEYYRASILSYYLRWYHNNFENLDVQRYYTIEFRNAYSAYFDFIAAESKELLKLNTLSPVERWLLNYFVNPADESYKQLRNSDYDGSLLQKSWITYHNEVPDIGGGGFSLLVGNWVPTGKLAILGNHPFIGYTLGGKIDEHVLMDLRFDFRFMNAPNKYIVPVDNTKFATNYFFGMNVGLDIGVELFRYRRQELDLIFGIAWEYFEAISSSDIDANNFKTDAGEYNSLNLNGGLVYRSYLTHKVKKNRERFSYVALQARYNVLFFHNNGGSDFNGGAWTLGLSYGCFGRRTNQYNIYYRED